MLIQLKVQFAHRQAEILEAEYGEVLRDVLLRNNINPNGKLAKTVNCLGNGICATCGVKILKGDTTARHWHDVLAKSYGYLRLSCQIRLYKPMTIYVDTEKLLWGKREKNYPT